MVQFFARSIPRISFHSHDLPSPPHPSPFPFLLMAFPPLLTPLLSLRFLGLSITLIFPFFSSLSLFVSSLLSPQIFLSFFSSLPSRLSPHLPFFPLPSRPFSFCFPHLLPSLPSPAPPSRPFSLLPMAFTPQDSCISQAMSKRALRASEISSALRSGRTFFSLLSS